MHYLLKTNAKNCIKLSTYWSIRQTKKGFSCNQIELPASYKIIYSLIIAFRLYNSYQTHINVNILLFYLFLTLFNLINQTLRVENQLQYSKVFDIYILQKYIYVAIPILYRIKEKKNLKFGFSNIISKGRRNKYLGRSHREIYYFGNL